MRLITYSKIALMAMVTVCFAACSSDDDPVEEKIILNIAANAPESADIVNDYSAFTVVATSERDNSKTTAMLSADGKATLTVDKGGYNIQIDGTVDNCTYTGTTGVKQFAANADVTIDVKRVNDQYAKSKAGLVFKELFYNGGTYAGSMRHPDQYVVIANNTDHTIYADSLVIAQSSNMNTLPCADLQALLPNDLAVANMYMIPGDGKTYPVKAGDVIVIASSAINHAEAYEFNKEKDTGIPADLSGADFELADEDASMTGKVTDNPEVPNLVKLFNGMPKGVTGWMHPYGIRPVVIFDGSGIDWATFMPAHVIKYKEKARVSAEIAEYQGYKIPVSLIVDGIETTSATTPYWGNYTSKTLPASVDKGTIEATHDNSCHHNSYLYRLTDTNGKLKDTNDASADCKVEHRDSFKGFPKGWRSDK